MSLKAGPTIFCFMPWQAVQLLAASRVFTSLVAGLAAAIATAGAGWEPTGAVGAVTVDTCPNAYLSLNARLPAQITRIQGRLAFQLNPTLPGNPMLHLVDSLEERSLDALPFGVIQLAPDGTILQYNRYEEDLARRRPRM